MRVRRFRVRPPPAVAVAIISWLLWHRWRSQRVPQQLDERRDDGGDATCSGGQLQRSLRVVLHPVLQGALHVGFGIQQQLQRRREATQGKKRLLRLFFSMCFAKFNKANQFKKSRKEGNP